MSTYDKLVVYKASYDLLVDIFQFTKGFKREYKYTIGESLKKEVIELITLIFRANSSKPERRAILQLAREKLEVIRLMMRLLNDLKQVTLKKFVLLSAKIECVSRQLAGWQKGAE